MSGDFHYVIPNPWQDDVCRCNRCPCCGKLKAAPFPIWYGPVWVQPIYQPPVPFINGTYITIPSITYYK